MIFFVLLLDQASKMLALHFMETGRSIPVIQGLFHLTLVHNTGIAFGILQGYQGLLLVLITLSLFFLFFWAVKMETSSPGGRIAFALILGGAVGNWVDRVRFGAVIDFLDFRVWPVFNIADSAITVGVALYLICLIRKESGKKTTPFNGLFFMFLVSCVLPLVASNL